MVAKKKTSVNEDEIVSKDDGAVVIDLGEIYKFDPKDIVTDITDVRYSNLSFIQVTHRDVYIDFLQMPGMKKDGKVIVDGTRVYMSHVAAQKLVEALKGVLEQVHSSGKIETFRERVGDKLSSTKIGSG